MSSDTLRDRVLDASVQLVSESGLAGLSMREVARRAGVSHQAPYHYFADKASIMAALVERGFAMLADRLEAARRAGATESALERAGRAYVRFALEQPVYFRLMFRPELSGVQRAPAADGQSARAFSVLQSLVDQRLDPRVRHARREALVSMNWALVHGLATLLLDGPLAHVEDRERHVDQVLRLFTEATAG
jgi:AcrR family transcriptional regulator